MMALAKGRYDVRLAQGPGDLAQAQRLRWLCFVGQRQGGAAAATWPGEGDGDGGGDGPLDRDDHDERCQQVLIRDIRSGDLVGCFRMLTLPDGRAIDDSYSARHYDLARLRGFPAPMVEIGRFCVHPARSDPDILRLAWGALARHVDAAGVRLVFGCSSFTGTEPGGYEDAFAMLRERHLAPRRWLPRVKAPQVFRFARALRRRKADPRAAMAAMPPLLRSYLAMGGWVSDHAVVDRQLDTLHVFTGLEIGAIPEARARLLRLAGA